MGKLAKQRRATMRDQLRKATDDNQRLRQLATNHQIDREAAQACITRLESQLLNMIAAVRLIDSRCAVLPVSAKILAGIERYRVPIQPREFYDRAMSMSSAHIEELTQFILTDYALHETGARALHFRVINPPGKPSFTTGYAVTHTLLRHCHAREEITRMICREFGAAIHATLFPKTP